MTKSTATHPAAERLKAFGWGKLDDREANELAAHLDTCADCQKAIDTQPDDAVVALVRKVVASPLAETTTAALAESWVPTELLTHPRYHLLRWLGAGGMGVVYEAEHRLMERRVAIKVISKKLTGDSGAVARFQKEVKAAAKLSHPNIVAAYDAEQAGDLHFLVMECIEGKSLAQVVESGGPLPVGLACEYARQVALGLQHASEQGMVHRDIKPQNLMLTEKGQIKILDFGLASFVAKSGENTALTKLGGLGTPDYIAPEQICDAHTVDIRADVYGLGCTLYFLLAGQPPFPGGSQSQKIMGHLQRSARPISELRGDLPDGLVRVVERMTAKSPDQRFPKPIDVAEALAPFVTRSASRRTAANGRGPSRIFRYVIAAGVLAMFAAIIFVFDLPARLSRSPAPLKENQQAPQANNDGKPIPNPDNAVAGTKPAAEAKPVVVDDAKFTDAQIEERFRETLTSNPLLMETPGAKIIKIRDGSFLLLGIASTVLKDDSSAERLRAEQVCKIKALREIVASTHGVQIASVQKIEDRNVVVIDKEGAKTSTVSEFLQITTARVEGIAQNMTVIGRWKSKDGGIFYLAVGKLVDRQGKPIPE